MVQLLELHHYAFLFGSPIELQHFPAGDPFAIKRVSTT